MNIKMRGKLIALALTTGLTLSSCGIMDDYYETVEAEVKQETIEKEMDVEESSFEASLEQNVETLEEQVEDIIEKIVEEPKKLTIDDAYPVDAVIATTDTYIYKDPTDETVVDYLKKNDLAEILDYEPDYFVIAYEDSQAYVKRSDVEETIIYKFDPEFQKIVMVTEPTVFETEEAYLELPKYECVEVYETIDDKYLGLCEGIPGYLSVDKTVDLTGTYAIVDISDQDIKLYHDQELIMSSPVTTGKHNATNIGEFEIYNISDHRYLVGPNYRSYVDYMLKFDGNIGLHDAEYHTNENGKKHGWRDYSEFGGETYINDGSHGCVNMPQEAARTAYEEMSIGDKVIVKK